MKEMSRDVDTREMEVRSSLGFLFLRLGYAVQVDLICIGPPVQSRNGKQDTWQSLVSRKVIVAGLPVAT